MSEKRSTGSVLKAYSIIEAKNFDENEEKITVRGIATTPTPDRTGDSVDPMGAKYATPMPLLWQHRSSEPVGRMVEAKQTKKGIEFVAEIPVVKEAGKLKERVDEAIHSLKYGLVSAVSIGFRILGGEGDGFEYMEDGYSWDIKKWEWLELSLVTIPANSEAMISAVKSMDVGDRATVSETIANIKQLSGGSGKPQTVSLISPAYNEEREVKAGTVKLIQGE